MTDPTGKDPRPSARTLQPGPWFACEEPERPTDASVRWHYEGCKACRIKADALEWHYPDDPHVQWLRGVMQSCLGPGASR